MHFAYPPRKSSNPPPFRPRSTRLPLLRRTRLRTIALIILAFLGGLYLLSGPTKPTAYVERVRSGTPPVVIVTVLDSESYEGTYLQSVINNREQYAARHGYQAFVVEAKNYDKFGGPLSWSKVLATHHALSKWPDCHWFWFLDQDAMIMNTSTSLEEHVLNPRRLESLMLRDQSVVPPDSIIKTFSHLRGQDIDLVLSQDKDGLVSDSVLIRNGDFAKFFIETWFDPLYRSYNFQKAERHALEHIVQWHVTVLSRLAIVPQRILAPYTRSEMGDTYTEGDLAVMFAGCDRSGELSCAKEAEPYYRKSQATYEPA